MSSRPILRLSSGQDEDEADTIVFSNPNEPFIVKPIIEDLLRTRYCIPGSVFLVEAVDRLGPIRMRYRAIRLLVSDGISCVQAVLKGETHGLVDDGQIYPGCYIRVEGFELRFLDMVDGDEGGNDVKGKGRARKMVYLLLDNPITVGWNTAYMRILESHEQVPVPELELPVMVEETGRSTRQKRPVDDGKKEEVPLPVAADKETLDTAMSDREDSPDYGSIADHDSIELDFNEIELPVLPVPVPAPQPDPTLSNPPVKPSSNAPQPQPSSAHLPWSTDDPTKPVKLTPLHMIPNLPYKQNWMVNVLAVVASISDVEPSHLPPYHQRTARLTVPSTAKQVLLTVFLDPDDFDPKVGSVVLLLGVKNHRFDGGSLKKYASDRPKGGARWWFEEPAELGWCDVAGLRGWWDGKLQKG